MAIYKRVHPTEREFWRIWPVIDSIEGLLASPTQERWLFKAARSLLDGANIVEIGSYIGRSTCCLAFGCRGTKKHVFAIDTFDGNDTDFHRRGFLKQFRDNIERAGLSSYVTPIKGLSEEQAATWDKPIHMLFIDGSHQYEDVLADFNGFFPHVAHGGLVAVHDVVETWPGPQKAWHEHIKHNLNHIGYCSTIGFGIKPLHMRHDCANYYN